MARQRSGLRRPLQRGDIAAILILTLILGAIGLATATLPAFNPFLPNRKPSTGAAWDCTWGTGAASSVCIKRPARTSSADAPGAKAGDKP